MEQNSYFFTGTVKSIKVIGEEYFFRFNGEPTVNDFFTKKQIVAQNENQGFVPFRKTSIFAR